MVGQLHQVDKAVANTPVHDASYEANSTAMEAQGGALCCKGMGSITCRVIELHASKQAHHASYDAGSITMETQGGALRCEGVGAKSCYVMEVLACTEAHDAGVGWI